MSKRKRKVSCETPQVREWGGTPETVRKLRRGTVEMLLNNGRIDRVHLDASSEIERVFKAVTGGLYTGNVMKERVDGQGKIGSLTEYTAQLYHDNFIPWATDLKGMQHRGGPPFYGITIDIIINGFTGRECDRRYCIGNGKSCDHLIYALDKYVDHAGWKGRR